VLSHTLRFDAPAPRLLSGIEAPTGAFAALRLSLPQLVRALTDERAAEGLVAEGNEPRLLQAIHTCLTSAAR
jgi:hypothetical protein